MTEMPEYVYIFKESEMMRSDITFEPDEKMKTDMFDKLSKSDDKALYVYKLHKIIGDKNETIR